MNINKLENDLFAVEECCYLSMKLNLEKCKVMLFGESNPNEVYCMTDSARNENNIEEKILRVTWL